MINGVDGFVNVVFDLPRMTGEWPPVGREALWAVPVTDRTVRLRSSPWFARGVANGDLIGVTRDADGQLHAVEHLEWSGWCVIRLIVFRDGPMAGNLQRALNRFSPFGLTGELLERYDMVALDVPPATDLPALKQLLRDGRRNGWWDVEEGCVGDAWRAA